MSDHGAPRAGDRRSGPRYRVEFPGAYVTRGRNVECRIVDLSAAGARVRATESDEPGARCELTIFANYRAYRFRGRVAWRDAEPELPQLGIQFAEAEPGTRKWLDDLIALLDARA